MASILERLTVEMLTADELARLGRMNAATNAYFGRTKKQLKQRTGQPDDNVRLNFARLFVDEGISYLFGKDVGMTLDPTSDAKSPAEEWLDKVWRMNRKMTCLQKLGMNGALCGQVFAKLALDPTRAGVRVIVIDPRNVAVTWDSADIDNVVRYKIQFNSLDPETLRPIVVRQVIEKDGLRWHVLDQFCYLTDTGGTPSGGWLTREDTFFPFPFCPVVDAQNLPLANEYWGLSDLEEDTLELVDRINFLTSNLIRIVRYHAHPKTWGKGFARTEVGGNPDDLLIFQNAEASLQNLEMQSDLASSVALYDKLKEALHAMNRVPEIATGKTADIGQLSGLALQILYGPLLKKTELKRRTYGDMLSELCKRMLAMGGHGYDQEVELIWPEILPSDPLAERQVAQLDQALGVSKATILRKLGYDPDKEAKLKDDEAASAGEAMLAAMERDMEGGDEAGDNPFQRKGKGTNPQDDESGDE